jgi:hypothetical protein
VVFPTANTTIRMPYVMMDIRLPSLNFISAVSYSIISVVRSVGSAVGDAISAVCGHHVGPLKLVAAEPEVQHR